MARIRSLHPGQWTDEAFVTCSPMARLLALGIRNLADDRGVFEWKPLGLKMQIFPADDVDVAALLSELAATDQVRDFSIGGKRYGAIRNFRKWQRPEKPKDVHPLLEELLTYVGLASSSHGGEPSPTIPPLRSLPLSSDQAPVADQSPTDPRKSPQRKEEGGEREDEDTSSLRSEDVRAGARALVATEFPVDAFERWYASFPNKVGRVDAERAFAKVRKGGLITFDRLMAGLARYVGKTDDRPWCNPATWLNQGRWDDAPAPAAPRGGRFEPPSMVGAYARAAQRFVDQRAQPPPDPDRPHQPF